jgi:parallel beta-helix repeat protein
MEVDMRRPIWLLLGLALALMLVVPTAASARTVRVHPGDSIQDGVDRARPGDTVLVYPGTYTEAGRPCPTEPGNTCAVVVEDENITIAGAAVAPRDVVLEATGGQELGISVGNTDDPACLDDPSLRLQGSTIRALTVKGFADDGVFLYCVDGWRVTRVRAIDNVEYGIFPSHSFNGRVDHSFTSGANDTGFYIGQSGDSRMDHNTATDNVSGYEIENSTNVRADHNLATGNTGGILVFTLPFLDKKVNSNNIVDHNTVTENDRPNTCVEPGDSVCQVPQGTGILVLAADDNQIGYNEVTGNDSFGIAVSNICVGQQLPPAICAIVSSDIQPDADGNAITHNTVTGNGLNPDPNLPPPFAVDLAWDTTGTGNCWSNNVFGTEFPPGLPAC